MPPACLELGGGPTHGRSSSPGCSAEPLALVGFLSALMTPSARRFSLVTWRQKAVLLVAVGCMVVPIGLKGAEIAFACVCMEKGTLSALRLARAADPGDPRVHHRLGEAGLYDLQNGSPRAALRQLQSAVSLAPNRAVYWEDLALAARSFGKAALAEEAIAHALSLVPVSPRVHWLAANSELNLGETERALPQLQKVLELGPTYSDAVYDLCLRSAIKPRLVETKVLPASDEPALGLRYAAFLVRQGQTAAGKIAWDNALASAGHFPFSQAQPYVDELMQRQDYSTAHQAWRGLEQHWIVKNHGEESAS